MFAGKILHNNRLMVCSMAFIFCLVLVVYKSTSTAQVYTVQVRYGSTCTVQLSSTVQVVYEYSTRTVV